MGDISTGFGDASSTFGQGASFRGLSIIDSPRFRELDRRQTYYDCTQHDYKRFDFDGRMISTGAGGGISATQPMISTEKAAFYVPLRSRRPSAPYRLARVITNAFTNLIFGEGRFPEMRVMGDVASQDFANALVKATNLPVKMIRARNLGGCIGTVGLSWAYVEGKPRIEVHNAKTLYVHSWEDREQHMPRHITEAYLYPKDEWDPQKKRFVRNFYWYRRDWCPTVDIIFKPLRWQQGVDPSPLWEPDVKKSVEHNDKLTHFVWIQNAPSDDIDGTPDYDGLYENFDALDLMLSVIVRGATLNLDPTLKLKMDRDLVERVGVRKGSDNALTVGKDGDAEYLELSGTSIAAGIQLFNETRKTILEVARCVIPDPDKIAAAATSAVSQKMIFQPMLGQGQVYREQYGTALSRLMEPMLLVARNASKSTVIIYDTDGNPMEAQAEVNLPPRIEQEPKLDDDGKPTGDMDVTKTPRHPGECPVVEPEWGERFPPTPMDQQSMVTTLTTAVGGPGTPIMSAQTATEILSGYFQRDSNDESSRMAQQSAANDEKAEKMAKDATDGDVGGKVEHEQQLPGGAKIKKTAAPKPPPPVFPPGMKPPGMPGAPGAKGAPPGAAPGGGGAPTGPPKAPKPPKPSESE